MTPPTSSEIIRMAEYLSDAHKKYTEFFGEPPQGTVKQYAAFLELYVRRQDKLSVCLRSSGNKG